jgi:general secretion pathway protein L
LNILSVDIGTYSVKIIEAFVEKKKVTVLNSTQIIVDDYRKEHKIDGDLYKVQFQIIKDYVGNIEANARVIFQAPNEILTSRFITIPVKNKKKAELMLPFQLEEDIPYGLDEAHIGAHTEVVGKVTEASVAICRKDLFDEFYSKINEFKLIPHFLTFEASVYADYVIKQNITVPTCILDIGHTTTKAYFFHEGKLALVNSSYISGNNINEAIEKSYQVSATEAADYKHKNAFFLTPNQYEDVDESQKQFAALMHTVMEPLVNEFKRWDIGFRLKYGNKISNLLITGGTSNIKNINNYLAQYLEVRVQRLDSFVDGENLGLADTHLKGSLNYAHIQANAARGKSKIINMLTGDYAQVATDDLPLHSMSFIGLRLGSVFAILMLFLGLEMWLLMSERNDYDKKIKAKYLKNPVLELSGADRRNFSRGRFEKVFRKLKRRRKFIEQEIKTIQAASKINAIFPLVRLSSLAASFNKTQLIKFESDEAGYVKAEFNSKDVQQLRTLESSLKNSEFKNVLVDVNELKKSLRVEFATE